MCRAASGSLLAIWRWEQTSTCETLTISSIGAVGFSVGFPNLAFFAGIADLYGRRNLPWRSHSLSLQGR